MPKSIPAFLDSLRGPFLLACLLGVALHLDPLAADPLAPKELWYVAAACGLGLLTAWKLWWGGDLRLPPPRVSAALIAWALAVGLARIFSPLPLTAQGPWAGWLLAAALLPLGVDLCSEERGRNWLLRGLGLSAALAGAWSVAQRLGWDPSAVGASQAAAFGGRVSAAFGNPNFAGGFFCLALPVLAHQAAFAPGRAWRWLARVAAGLALLGLAFSACKAAWLGLGAAAAIAAHLCFWSPAGAGRKRAALAWLGGALGLGLALSLLLLPTDSRQRLLGGPAAWSGSVSFREQTWAGTWAMARARPVTGWGPGTFSAAYPAFRPTATMAGQTQHAYEVTRPENWPLELLAETGWLGLAAALALLGALLWPLRGLARGWDKDPERAGLALALLAALGGSLACNLAALDLFLPSTLLPFVALAALGAALATDKAPVLGAALGGGMRWLMSAGLLLLAAAPVAQAQMRWRASDRTALAEQLSRAGRLDEAVAPYQEALQLDPGQVEARYFLGCDLQDQGKPQDRKDAEAAFAELRQWAPDYVQVHARLGRLYQSEGRLPEAEAEYQ
ncbi:MAG TPA: O-antigen ligase family protein, partial [bacterium]|nr:O-antigen ligase family protein [bacterium]